MEYNQCQIAGRCAHCQGCNCQISVRRSLGQICLLGGHHSKSCILGIIGYRALMVGFATSLRDRCLSCKYSPGCKCDMFTHASLYLFSCRTERQKSHGLTSEQCKMHRMLLAASRSPESQRLNVMVHACNNTAVNGHSANSPIILLHGGRLLQTFLPQSVNAGLEPKIVISFPVWGTLMATDIPFWNRKIVGG